VTLATLPIDPPDEVKRFGVVEVNQRARVIGFQEKPKTHHLALALQSQRMVDASMGIYIFNTDVRC
jgi:ADP-glucose pyrophosphorylase